MQKRESRRICEALAAEAPADPLNQRNLAMGYFMVARIASSRWPGEREDLRWVNGHPQFVLDHDLIAVALSGRTVAAVRVTPVASADAWGLGELLLHSASPEQARLPWDEWLDPALGWEERRRALLARAPS